MTSERWRQIEQIYEAARHLDAKRRALFLDQACDGDEELRQELATLLASDGEADGFLTTPALQVAAQSLAATDGASLIGRRIDHYEIQALLGRGGMGEVYQALDTRLRRKVAIKLLPAEFTRDPDRVRRFEQEARAASALNHPNIITIYEINAAPTESGNSHSIVTEYVEGETLRERMTSALHQRLSIAEAVEIAVQVAAALAAAHEAGIIHRDIKPENVMIRHDSYVKVLDFGLAKLTEAATPPAMTPPAVNSQAATLAQQSTGVGVVLGTPRYMSPEQARGEKVDGRTDVFSLGVMLYEMVAGRAPFTGTTSSEVIAAILRDAAPPLAEQAPDAPPELERIILRALSKDRNERYATSPTKAAKELQTELKAFQQRGAVQAELERARQHADTAHASGGLATHFAPTDQQASNSSTSHVLRGEIKRHRRFVALAGAVLLVIAAGLYYWRSANLRWARDQVPRIEELVQAERLFEAYDLASRVRKYLPQEATLARLTPLMSADLTIVTEPPGAQVYVKRFAPDASGNFPARQLIGTTPLNHMQVALGGYLLTLEKAGYAKFERTIIGPPPRSGFSPPPIRYEEKLMEAARVPDRMAFVPGGDYRLSSWNRPTDERVRLDDYLIDKFEVTNREYKEFINAGGYRQQQFWKYPFRKDGKPRTWEEAMRELKDRTGLPGPRNWSGQEFPEGRADYPVTEITWYEAAAYAAFRGKQLPTIFQWEKAARGTRPLTGAGQLMPWGLLVGTVEQRANFNSGGTLPVASLEFGTSPYGCYHMAGNVSEWLLNEMPDGFATGGGSWADPVYTFGAYGAYPGFYSSDRLGFRCALKLPEASGNDGGTPIKEMVAAPAFVPVSDTEFAPLLAAYRYEQPPLAPQVVEVIETDAWRREKITFVGADAERAIAYLYLPKAFPRPMQVIQYVPAGSVWSRNESLPHAVETQLAALIKAGRAVFAVVLKGYPEREWPATFTPPAYGAVEYRDQMVNWSTDLRRGLDYLETRSEIDRTRIIYIGESATNSKIIFPAVEPRYRAVVLTGAGLREYNRTDVAGANPINFAPHIHAPKLMLQGRYDEMAPLKTSAEPLFQLLREPKRLVLFEGGHTAPIEMKAPVVNGWLDEQLGPPKRE